MPSVPMFKLAERGRDTLVSAEAKLTELETEAVATAPSTPGVVEALEAFRHTSPHINVVVDRNLYTGQNPFSSEKPADKIVSAVTGAVGSA